MPIVNRLNEGMQSRADRHKALFSLIQNLREFFLKKNFLDVLTPPLVQNPGMEVHISPFKVESIKAKHSSPPYYLHTSPEFHMKELLSLGMGNIFTINYCFRDEPESHGHRPQFLMLEWYREQSHYKEIMTDCSELLQFLQPHENIQIVQKTIEEIFFDILNIKIFEFLEKEKLIELIKKKFPEVPMPQDTEPLLWEDFFFLLFLNKIEPQLKNYPFLILDEFPSQLAALSTIKKFDPRVCERFELYINGVEIGNCFNELIDKKEQKKRFEEIAIAHYNPS